MSLQLQQVVREDAIHHLAIAESHAHPKAVHFGSRMEDQAVGWRIGGLEILNKTNGFYLLVRDDSDGAVGFHQLHPRCQLVALWVDKARQWFPVKAPDQHLLGCGACQTHHPLTKLFQTFSRLLYHWHNVRWLNQRHPRGAQY